MEVDETAAQEVQIDTTNVAFRKTKYKAYEKLANPRIRQEFLHRGMEKADVIQTQAWLKNMKGCSIITNNPNAYMVEMIRAIEKIVRAKSHVPLSYQQDIFAIRRQEATQQKTDQATLQKMWTRISQFLVAEALRATVFMEFKDDARQGFQT